jgi:hypothetical protein
MHNRALEPTGTSGLRPRVPGQSFGVADSVCVDLWLQVVASYGVSWRDAGGNKKPAQIRTEKMTMSSVNPGVSTEVSYKPLPMPGIGMMSMRSCRS